MTLRKFKPLGKPMAMKEMPKSKTGRMFDDIFKQHHSGENNQEILKNRESYGHETNS